jgi:hypothetical protein
MWACCQGIEFLLLQKLMVGDGVMAGFFWLKLRQVRGHGIYPHHIFNRMMHFCG